MSVPAAETTQPATGAAPVQQMEQPVVSSVPNTASQPAQPVPDTSNTNSEYISPEPPAYNETMEKNQTLSNQPAQANQQARMVTPLVRLGEEPARVDCPYCKKITMTRVGQESSTMTVLAGFLLACICVCLACLPCIMHSCADIDHYCSECNKKLTHRPYDKPIQVVAVYDSEMRVSKYPESQQIPSEQPGQIYK